MMIRWLVVGLFLCHFGIASATLPLSFHYRIKKPVALWWKDFKSEVFAPLRPDAANVLCSQHLLLGLSFAAFSDHLKSFRMNRDLGNAYRMELAEAFALRADVAASAIVSLAESNTGLIQLLHLYDQSPMSMMTSAEAGEDLNRIRMLLERNATYRVPVITLMALLDEYYNARHASATEYSYLHDRKSGVIIADAAHLIQGQFRVTNRIIVALAQLKALLTSLLPIKQ